MFNKRSEVTLPAGWHINMDLNIYNQLHFLSDRVHVWGACLMCTLERILPDNPSSSWTGFIALAPHQKQCFNSWYCFKTCLYLPCVAGPGLSSVCSEFHGWSESSSRVSCAWEQLSNAVLARSNKDWLLFWCCLLGNLICTEEELRKVLTFPHCWPLIWNGTN